MTEFVRMTVESSISIDEKCQNDCSIAVVVVGHNPGRFLSEMLESLYRQIDPPDEIIYYDDGSHDGSLDIISEWQPKLKTLKIIDGRQQLGISAARNIANSMAKSNYIAVLDADDLFLDDSIKKYRRALRENPNVDLLYADTLVFSERSQKQRRMRYPSFMENSPATWKVMTSPVVPFKHSSVIYRKKTIERLGGYREDLPLKVDFDLFVRFIKNEAKIKKLDSATSHHRTHRGQISKKRIKGIFLYWKIIDAHESRLVHSSLFKLLKTVGEIVKFAVGR